MTTVKDGMSDFEALRAILLAAGMNPHCEEPDPDLEYYHKYGGPMPGKAITIVNGSWGCRWPLPPGSPQPDHSQDYHTLFRFDREGKLLDFAAYDGADY
jgi:hypothetical protein